jgi:transcriptional regulator with XRE-family HTH domain
MGVSASTLTRMAQGASPDVDGFAKMVAWLGVSADDFIERGSFTKANQKGSEDLLVVVSRNLRASKEFDTRSTQALENLIAAAYKQMKELKSK